MGTPSYVVNWEELIGQLEDKIEVTINGDFNFDLGPLEAILGQYFPDILELLRALVEQTKRTGIQRMQGVSKQVMASGDYRFILRPESDILLTGLTYAQSQYICDDTFDLVVASREGVEIPLFLGLSVKDSLQQKFFARFFPVPSGYEVVVILHAASGGKDAWVDFEYLDLDVPVETGTVMIRYLANGSRDQIVLGEESKSYPYGLNTVGNIKNFTGYRQKPPVARVVYLSGETPIKVVEFWYEQTGDIAHDYDIKVTLRWESNSSVDLDLHGYINHRREWGVNFTQKEYFASADDKLWLDFDYRKHGPNGYEVEGEVITVLGFAGEMLSIQLDNFNGGSLRSDPVLEVAIDGKDLVQRVVIPRALLNLWSTGKVWVCDIELASQSVLPKLVSITEMGVF